MPGKVGMVSGLLFGLAFGMGGIASAALGRLADLTSITFVFVLCGFLPLIGLLSWFLPDIEGASRRERRLQREATDPTLGET
jgi:FSR family fosmidomycin resistance protein-like MFS transporter